MSMKAPLAASDAHSPSVLWKAFDVLDAFDQGQRILTLSEVARRSDLPKSTVHRILGMLLEVQAVERSGHGYKIGLRIFSMGALSVDARLRERSLPHLERLRRITRHTVHIATLQGSEVVYLDKLPSSLSPNTPALVGGRLPAHRTGVGKALLAFTGDAARMMPEPSRSVGGGAFRADDLGRRLETVRRTGIAGDREEAAPGLACVAAPIMSGGRALAAVSVAFAASDGSGEVFLNPLRETVAALSRLVATCLANLARGASPSGPLSSCHSPQAALKFSYHSDSVTRD